MAKPYCERSCEARQLTVQGYQKIGCARALYAWQLALRHEASQGVVQSSLLAGEYNNSTVHVGTRSLALGNSYHSKPQT